MNCLLALLVMSQSQVVIDPAAKVKIDIQSTADIKVLPSGVQIVVNGTTIIIGKGNVLPTPSVPDPVPVPEVLNDRSKDFLASFVKAVPEVKNRKDAARVAIPVIDSVIGQAGGLGWSQEQVVEGLASGLSDVKFGVFAKGFKMGDWLAAQHSKTVEELVAVLRDIMSALKEI